jgi:geranylgeranyl pyrophosphate synthase
MKDLQRTRLIGAFTDHLLLPATLGPHLKKALKRVLQNPVSLSRPEIAAEVALDYEVPQAIATDVAIALEYFHTASLLFDDLPGMDDAVERGDIPSVHLSFVWLYGSSVVLRIRSLFSQAVDCRRRSFLRRPALPRHTRDISSLESGQGPIAH